MGKGCTTAWFIDEDCDGHGVAVRSSGVYGAVGLGDRPDADDADAQINTPASVLTSYDANKNGILDTTELKAFMRARRGYEIGNVYYISTTTGNNSTGTVNNPALPFATYSFGAGRTMQPGDAAVFLPGTHNEPQIGGGAGYIASGIEGKPTYVLSFPGAITTLQTAISPLDLRYSHDVIVDGFTLDNPNYPGLGTGISMALSSRTTVRNVEVQRFNYLSSIDGMHDVLFERFISHHQTEHGLYLGARENPSNNVTVRKSLFYKNGVESGYGAVQYNGPVTNLVMDSNIIHSNGQWGISLKQGVSNSVFQNNLIFNNQGHGIIFDIYPADCAGGQGSLCPTNLVGNRIVNNTIWIGKYDLKGETPVGNIPTNAAAILVARNVGTVGDGHDLGRNTFQNNILVTFNGPAFRYTSAEWLDTTSIMNNLLYCAGSCNTAVAVYGSAMYGFTAFESSWPLVYNNKFANPSFADVNIDYWGTPGLFDLNLSSSSPAIALGLSTGAPSYDLRGATRAMPPDAGAYKYLGGPPGTTAPAAPTNLRIVR
jgi:parallel beta-helix repeat protein